MKNKIFPWLLVTLLLNITQVQAELRVPSDFNPGDTYRVVFNSSPVRDRTSRNVVNLQATVLRKKTTATLAFPNSNGIFQLKDKHVLAWATTYVDTHNTMISAVERDFAVNLLVSNQLPFLHQWI